MVEARNVLWESVVVANYSFDATLSSSSSSSSSSSCSSLWDPSPNSLYGIQTFPSGLSLLPSSLRSSSLTITTKALSFCEEIGKAKDILAPFTFNWFVIEYEIIIIIIIIIFFFYFFFHWLIYSFPSKNRAFLDPIPDKLADVDPNDWAQGGGAVLTIPSLFLENRDYFPMDVAVGIQVIIFIF